MLTQQNLPNEVQSLNFQLPEGYYRVFELNLTNLDPWHFIDGEEFEGLYRGLRQRYPGRLLIPFARRRDNDDVACFVVQSTDYPKGHILIVHDFASPGSEVDADLEDFWAWFRLAVNEMIEWTSRR